jgi:V8-like Glu-specific endopeptidase
LLDYALLRLENEPTIGQRSPLHIAPHISFYQGDRLNIVQYPAGGALRYAIRNNFYIGEGRNTNFIRYLTDTEFGASGSPICNDDWYVVGMHRATYEADRASYRGEVIILTCVLS